MEKVLPAMQQSAWCDLRAIASRSLDSARKAADRLGIERAYGSYEELLADPEIEAVYNPLPNHLHVPMTLAAARAGKHVLCEKPIAIDANQAAELREVAGQVHIMEAFMVRLYAQGFVSSGQAGTVLGLSRVDFLDVLGRYGVPVFDSDVDFDAEAAVLDAACGPARRVTPPT